MNLRWLTSLSMCAALLAGCASDRSNNKVFLDRAPIVVEGADGTLEPILFPDYFLLEESRLNDHGRIPRTNLIGAGMTCPLDLSEVRVNYGDVLHYYGWETERLEMGQQYFRIMASRGGEAVEIRGVQGSSGPTQIFLLYTLSED